MLGCASWLLLVNPPTFNSRAYDNIIVYTVLTHCSDTTFLHIIIPSWQLTMSMHQIGSLICSRYNKQMVKVTILFLLCTFWSDKLENWSDMLPKVWLPIYLATFILSFHCSSSHKPDPSTDHLQYHWVWLARLLPHCYYTSSDTSYGHSV